MKPPQCSTRKGKKKVMVTHLNITGLSTICESRLLPASVFKGKLPQDVHTHWVLRQRFSSWRWLNWISACPRMRVLESAAVLGCSLYLLPTRAVPFHKLGWIAELTRRVPADPRTNRVLGSWVGSLITVSLLILWEPKIWIWSGQWK
jgi:hypothetical protein